MYHRNTYILPFYILLCDFIEELDSYLCDYHRNNDEGLYEEYLEIKDMEKEIYHEQMY